MPAFECRHAFVISARAVVVRWGTPACSVFSVARRKEGLAWRRPHDAVESFLAGATGFKKMKKREEEEESSKKQSDSRWSPALSNQISIHWNSAAWIYLQHAVFSRFCVDMTRRCSSTRPRRLPFIFPRAAARWWIPTPLEVGLFAEERHVEGSTRIKSIPRANHALQSLFQTSVTAEAVCLAYYG